MPQWRGSSWSIHDTGAEERDTKAGGSLEKKKAQEDILEMDYNNEICKQACSRLMLSQDWSKEMPELGYS